MAVFSFDIVSDYDKSELNNAFDQASRELGSRYDFKGTSAALEWLDDAKSGIKLTADSQYQLDAVLDIFRKKLAIRGQNQKLLDTGAHQPVTSNLKTTWQIPFKKGLSADKAKRITSLLRTEFPKVKATIQGEEIRVSSQKKDELQAVMSLLRGQDFDFPLDFTNYR